METKHPLESLISISHLPVKTSGSERLIKVGPKEKTTGGLGALVSNIFGTTSYYLVRTGTSQHDQNAVTRKGLILEYKSARQGKPFRCTADYVAWCRNMHAERFVEYYAEGSETMGLRADEAISRVFSERLSDTRLPWDLTAETLNVGLEQLLDYSIGNHPSGLDMRFTVKHSYYIPGREITLPKTSVSPRNAKGTIEVEGNIHLLPLNNISFSNLEFAESQTQFLQRLQETLKECFLQEVNAIDLHGISIAPSGSPVERRLSGFFHRYGFEVSKANLRVVTPLPSIPTDFPIETPIKVNLKMEGYDESVPLNNILLLQLANAEDYLHAGAPDLKNWANRNVQEVVRDVLFGEQYVDVLIDFDTYRDKIRYQMEERAKQIGYHVRHLTSDPETSAYALLKKLVITSGGPAENPEEISFSTRESKVDVSIAYVAYGRLANLKSKSIRELLSKNADILAEMNRSIKVNLGQILNGIAPVEFYTQFTFAAEGPTVEKKLIGGIRAALNEFGVELDSDPSVKMGRTDIVQRLEDLRKEMLEIPVDLVRHGTAEKIRFNVTLSIDAIPEEQYLIFALRAIGQNLPIEILREKVIKSLASDLSNKLSSKSRKQLWFQDEPGRVEMMKEIEQHVCPFARTEFGLTVHVVTFGRGQAGWEEKTGDILEAQLNEIAETQLHYVKTQGKLARKRADNMLANGHLLNAEERKAHASEMKEHIAAIKEAARLAIPENLQALEDGGPVSHAKDSEGEGDGQIPVSEEK